MHQQKNWQTLQTNLLNLNQKQKKHGRQNTQFRMGDGKIQIQTTIHWSSVYIGGKMKRKLFFLINKPYNSSDSNQAALLFLSCIQDSWYIHRGQTTSHSSHCCRCSSHLLPRSCRMSPRESILWPTTSLPWWQGNLRGGSLCLELHQWGDWRKEVHLLSLASLWMKRNYTQQCNRDEQKLKKANKTQRRI